MQSVVQIKKGKGALVSEDALHFDGDKPNSVSPDFSGAMIIYLVPRALNARTSRKSIRAWGEKMPSVKANA